MLYCNLISDYVDTLLDLLFNEVLRNPGQFQELFAEVSDPGHLSADKIRPDTSSVVAHTRTRFAQGSITKPR